MRTHDKRHWSFPRLAVPLLAGVLTQTPGCDEQTCTADDRPSVSVRVLDEAGDPVVLEPGSVTYAIDGGETRTVAAEFSTLDNPVAIWGSEGEYVVTVSPAGYEPGVVSANVGLTENGCHPVLEEREIVLVALED